MRSLTEQPALLSIHQGSPGQYILRVSDLRYRPLVVQVSKALEDAASLVVITPSDIKVYEVTRDEQPETVSGGETEAEGPAMSDSELAAISAQEEIPVPGQVEETPPKAVRRRKPDSVAGHDEPCMRCSGQGMIRIIPEGGSPSDSPCPICKGTGVMKRYGAKR